MSADDVAYFIRCRGDICSIVKLHPDGREEILEHGLTRADAEVLYLASRCGTKGRLRT
jgi:hypothetical protein